MVCSNCKLKSDRLISAVINGKYIKDQCEICLGLARKEVPASSTRVDFRIRRQQEDHRRDILQPYANGKPSREFIKAYPDKAKNYFTPEQITKAERS